MKMRFFPHCGLAAGLLALSSCSFFQSLIQADPPTTPAPNPPVSNEVEEEGEAEVPIRSYAETPTAKWTDDIPNTVWSPYLDGRRVAVDGIEPGTLVADPNCPEPMKSLFYVPEVPGSAEDGG